MAGKAKQKQQAGLSRQEQQRLKALEEDLFAGKRLDSSVFGNEVYDAAERLPADYGQEKEADQAQPLLIWEDRGRANANVGEDSEGTDDESDSEDNTEDEQPAGTESGDDVADHAAGSEERASLEKASEEDEPPENNGNNLAGTAPKRQAAWNDPDEEAISVNIASKGRLRKLRGSEAEAVISGTEYSARLKQQHMKLNPRTSWASLKRKRKTADLSDDEAAMDEAIETLDQGALNLLTQQATLPAGLLQVTRLKDANQQDPSNAGIQSVEFHPNGELLLTAGLDKKLKFFQVDGVKNAKVQSIHIADLPIHKAAFACRGSKVIASGRRKHFYLFDIQSSSTERICNLTNRSERSLERFVVAPSQHSPLVAFLGNKGSIPLVSLDSRQVVAQLKMSGSVKSATFSDDSSLLFASGSDGLIQTWDMRTRRCLSRFVDEGALRGAALASSPGQQYLASGSDAGFVNIYNQSLAVEAGKANLGMPTAPTVVKPMKALTSLLTTVDLLSFSPDGQILAMASKSRKDAMRLVHTRTMTVFSNWPTSRSPMHYLTSMAFSPGGGFFAVGNAKGRVLLYRLHHYEQA